MNTSPFLAMQDVERQLKILLRAVDMDLLDTADQKAVANLKRLMVDARLDIRDYELSETREEQLKNAVEAKKRIAKLEAIILAATEIFSAIDTADVSAQLEQIKDWLH